MITKIFLKFDVSFVGPGTFSADLRVVIKIIFLPSIILLRLIKFMHILIKSLCKLWKDAFTTQTVHEL